MLTCGNLAGRHKITNEIGLYDQHIARFAISHLLVDYRRKPKDKFDLVSRLLTENISDVAQCGCNRGVAHDRNFRGIGPPGDRDQSVHAKAQTQDCATQHRLLPDAEPATKEVSIECLGPEVALHVSASRRSIHRCNWR